MIISFTFISVSREYGTNEWFTSIPTRYLAGDVYHGICRWPSRPERKVRSFNRGHTINERGPVCGHGSSRPDPRYRSRLLRTSDGHLQLRSNHSGVGPRDPHLFALFASPLCRTALAVQRPAEGPLGQHLAARLGASRIRSDHRIVQRR